MNRLTNLTDFSNHPFTFSYDALSRRTQLTRVNGVNTIYSYDSLSRLLSVQHQHGGKTLDGASYTYDAAGNRASLTCSPKTGPSSDMILGHLQMRGWLGAMFPERRILR